MKKILATLLSVVLLLSLGSASLAAPKDELVVGLSGLRTAIDPVLANFNSVSSIGKHIFNTLVKYDMDNRVVPDVAAEWSRPDDLTWQFTVDVDAYKFHTGDPLTMDDVVFSIARCFDIPQALDYVAGIADITYEGNVLTIKTETPNNKLLHDLTSLVIVSEKVITEAGENWGQTAVGTGPYKLVSFIPSNEVVVERWEDHPSLKPAIRKITFRAVSDPTSRYIGIENGEFGFVDQVSGAGDIARATQNDKLHAEIIETLGMRFMAVNASKAPFDNPKVREALQYIIDRESIISLGNGIDKPANTMISEALPAHSDVQIGQFDPEQAKALLAEAGYPDGFDTTLWIYAESWKTIAEMMQAVMAQAGITVTIEQYEIGAFFDLLDKGEHMMLLGSQTASPYAIGSLNMYYSSDFFGSSGNFGFYVNEAAAELINKALATPDADEEIALSKQVQEIVAKDNPYYPISYTSDCRVTVKELKGCEFYPNSLWYLGNAYFEE